MPSVTTEPSATSTSRPRLAAGREVVASLGGIVLVLVAAALLTPTFYSGANLANLIRQIGIIGVAAIGQTLVLLVAGIDLSVGALIGLAMVVAAELTGGSDAALPTATAAVLALGLAAGGLNAALVVLRRVPPFVATFATFVLVRGLLSAWTRGAPSGQIPPALDWLGARSIAGIPTPALIFAVLLAAAWLTLAHTGYGRRIYATGANPVAARLSGVPTRAVTASTYVISALLAVLSGLMISGYTGYVDAYLTRSLDLDSVAAAVVGGTSLAGGKGGVLRTTVGVVLIATLINFMGLLGAGQAGQLLIEGAVILAAVWLQTRGRAGRARPRRRHSPPAASPQPSGAPGSN